MAFTSQIVELSMRLIVMWSVPFNLNLYDTYMGLALIYNEVTLGNMHNMHNLYDTYMGLALIYNEVTLGHELLKCLKLHDAGG